MATFDRDEHQDDIDEIEGTHTDLKCDIDCLNDSNEITDIRGNLISIIKNANELAKQAKALLDQIGG